MKGALCSAVLAATAALGVVSGAQATPVQHTIAYQAGHIRSVAQNADVVGWITLQPDSSKCVAVVRLRNLSTHTQVALNKAGGPTCESDQARIENLAIASDSSAIWVLPAFGNDAYFDLIRGTSAGTDTQLKELVWSESNDQVVDTAGADTTAVFAWSESQPSDACLVGTGTCTYFVEQGGVETASGVAVPNAPPAAAVAGSAGYVAILLAGTIKAQPIAHPADVEIRKVTTGAVVGHFTASAPVEGLALSPHYATVLTAGKIERYTVYGAHLGNVSVPSGTGEMSASDTWIVYRVGNVIHAVRQDGGGTPQTFTAASTPRSLSIVGNRVIWAETYAKHKDRIQSVTLP